MENNKVKEELVITDWQHNFSLEMTTLSRVVSNMLPQGENNLSLENIFLHDDDALSTMNIFWSNNIAKKTIFPTKLEYKLYTIYKGYFHPV